MRIQRSLSGRLDVRQAENRCAGFKMRGQAGFSLVEVMVVIAIMGIILAIALPSFSDWRERTAAKTAADALMAHLKQARITAMADNRSVSMVFTATGYTFDSGGPKQKEVKLAEYSPVLTLTASLSPLTFTSRGTAGSDNIKVINPNGKTWTLIVNSIGRVYFQ